MSSTTAISLETGAIVVDEDVYATIRRPEGVGTRHDLKSSDVIAALGISRKEWGEILVRCLPLALRVQVTWLTYAGKRTPDIRTSRAGIPPRWQGNFMEAKEFREEGPGSGFAS
jgi:hypothetical protein